MKASKLTASQIDMELKNVSEWKSNANGEIEKSFTLTAFPQALMFVNAVGLLAEAHGHHPDITINYNKVKLALITHDSGGLTMKDFDLAKLINSLPII
jgi:4a-hydroxytetrahydrobiopterin dehydratase